MGQYFPTILCHLKDITVKTYYNILLFVLHCRCCLNHRLQCSNLLCLLTNIHVKALPLAWLWKGFISFQRLSVIVIFSHFLILKFYYNNLNDFPNSGLLTCFTHVMLPWHADSLQLINSSHRDTGFPPTLSFILSSLLTLQHLLGDAVPSTVAMETLWRWRRLSHQCGVTVVAEMRRQAGLPSCSWGGLKNMSFPMKASVATPLLGLN